MKKILLVAFILFSTANLFSQNFSFGVVLGSSYIVNTVQNSSNRISGGPTYRVNKHFGVFGDYQFSDRFGVKLNTQYNRSYENYEFYFGGYDYVDFTFSLNSIQIIPQLKFDVKTEYNKGLYLLAGPRMSFLLSAKDQSGADVKDFYKSYLIGAQLGFGFNPSKYFAIEFIGDYGFSDISEAEPIEIKTFGGYINFAINLESIINK